MPSLTVLPLSPADARAIFADTVLAVKGLLSERGFGDSTGDVAALFGRSRTWIERRIMPAATPGVEPVEVSIGDVFILGYVFDALSRNELWKLRAMTSDAPAS